MSLTKEDKHWITGLAIEIVKAILFGVEDIVLNRVYAAKEHVRKFIEANDIGN